MLLPRTHQPHPRPQLPLPIQPKTLIPNPVFPSPKPTLPLLPALARRRGRSITACAPAAVPDSAIRRIADKLRSLGFSPETSSPGLPPSSSSDVASSSSSSPGEIFVPLPSRLPKHRVGHTMDTSWSTPEFPVPEPGGDGGFVARYSESRRRIREERLSRMESERGQGVAEKVPTLAELRLSPRELRRLTTEGLKLKKKLKVGKAGITEGIVNGIHERWRRSELVKISCEDICKMNMKRTHDLLERKTGGLVVWRSGSVIILYRGADYQYPYFSADDVLSDEQKLESSDVTSGETDDSSSIRNEPESVLPIMKRKAGQVPPIIHGVGSPDKVRFQLPGESEIAQEADRLLDGLGPRFTDWWGYEPLPVDADLLPAVVPGYRKPFRLLPYGVKPTLTNDEMTTLRRLGRPLPCHFALGRNRNLEGLAACIVKLWEKCEIAKVAVKRGVQNTNSEMMAEQLKRLTGGSLLSRDKDYIVLYRGKDFLPHSVSSAIEERRNHQINGGKASNLQSNTTFSGLVATEEKESTNVSCQNNIVSTDVALMETREKLSVALEKKARAEKALEELNNACHPEPSDADKEGITQEERYMLRKIGLRMDPFLLLGRRSVFDGTIENMHLHWKYRELVKVICKDRDIETVHSVARTLESESGGILVAVERVSKGHAIIVYRGKNYQRPSSLRPDTLLSKKEALRRSKEAQRRKSLKLHVLKLSEKIKEMEFQLARDSGTNSTHSSDKSSPEVTTDADLECVGRSDEVVLGPHEKVMEAGSDHEDDANMTIPTDGDCSPRHGLESHQEDELIKLSNRFDDTESSDMNTQVSQEPLIKVSELDMSSREDVASGLMTPSLSMSARRRFNIGEMDDDPEEAAELSESGDTLDGLIGLTKMPKRLTLSNKERLVLRKQALGMRKRPMVAIGRSNVLKGIAKMISLHFKKHPLVIVNVKGRAEGTSIKELVFRLEQATGAVLVSQETNKIILYRGWGAEEGVGNTKGRGRGASARTLADCSRAQHPVSPDLLAAVRFECGLSSDHSESDT
ncbi:hypothetical protein MLD38_001339 [Melastoma candidum]|uniref:Uncharacterized protein n=1 Tax=Melastoma candidum TaxID=119954 RepID=A0ACB9SDW9_9MYRT|nr:hypothetical protein MLD38_001339 [Melastoma candidum]